MSEQEQTEGFQKQFQELKQKISSAIETTEAGDMPDLGSMEQDVTTLCAAVDDAPAPVAKAVQNDMAELISTLDRLAIALGELKAKE